MLTCNEGEQKPLLSQSPRLSPKKKMNKVESREYKHLAAVIGTFEMAIILLYALFVDYSDQKLSFNDVEYIFFLDVTIMMLVGFGFLMTFMRNNGLSAVGMTFLVTAISLQLCVLSGRFFASLAKNDDYTEFTKDNYWPMIELNINALLQGDFAAAAVLISFGAVIGKITPSQIAIMTIIEVIIYSFNKEYICVGLLNTLDMGGTIFIHLFGAYFGLAIAWVLGKPTNSTNADPSRVSDVFSLLGTVFLWIYWPSFNGATAPLGTNQQGLTTVNTVLALCGSCVVTFLLSAILNKKLCAADIQNATLAGGVCVGASSNLRITPVGALAVGVCAGALSTFGFTRVQSIIEDKFGIHDSCGVHNLHGMPALLGTVVVTIATAIPSCQGNVVYSEYQSLSQALGALATLTVALVTGSLTGLLLKATRSHAHTDKEFDDDAHWEVAPGTPRSFYHPPPKTSADFADAPGLQI